MTVKIEDINIGDRVTVSFVVNAKAADEKDPHPILCEVSSGDILWVALSEIIEHHPAPNPLKVGDWVMWGDRVFAWQIVAFDADKACLSDMSRFSAYWTTMSSLSHADDATPRA